MQPNSLAILLGAKPALRSADTEYRFRQNSDFFYLTGFAQPNAAALIRNTDPPEYSLFVEPRLREREIWTGFRPGVEGALADYGADRAHPIDEFSTQLQETLRGVEHVYCILGHDSEVDRKLIEGIESLRRESRKGTTAPTQILDLRSLVHEMRLLKSDTELAQMRKAAEITYAAHHAAAKIARTGRFEYEIEATLDYTFRSYGATGPAYSTIVGGGANATVLHYIANDAPLRDGELVLIDAGCEWQGYASDVTRTYPVGGRYQGEKRALYEVVLAAQHAAIEVARPGSTLPQIHETVVRKLVEGLVSLDILQGDVQELIANKAYEPYYMHSTSHWLGLDVHDVGAYALTGEARKLEPGMVFTIEPGLYIATDAKNAPENFRGIGVRIEDNLRITDTGHEVLTAAIPKEIAAIEDWMKET